MCLYKKSWTMIAAFVLLVSGAGNADAFNLLDIESLLPQLTQEIGNEDLLIRSRHKHHSHSYSSHHEKHHAHKKHHSCHEKQKPVPEICKIPCKCKKVIYAKDINPKGYVINESGTYCLGEDVVFKPNNQKDLKNPKVIAAITIKAPNVTLDLGSHQLSQFVPANPKEQVPFVVGILVPDLAPTNPDVNFEALRSIYITGSDRAIINGFSMFGVRIFAHTSDIQLSNLTVKNCGTLASKALRPFSNYFPHSSELTAYGPGFAVAGIAIGESAGFGLGPTFFTEKPFVAQNRVSEVRLENVCCFNNFSNGIILVNTTDFTINNSHFDKTFSDDPGFNDTQPNGSQGPLAYNAIPAYNGNFWGGADNIVEANINGVTTNSTFNGAYLNGQFSKPIITFFDGTSDLFNGVFPCYGAVDTHGQNLQWINCQFNNSLNTAVGGLTGGFLGSDGEGIVFENCSFDGHQALSDIQAFHRSGATVIPVSEGFITTISSRSMKMINCTANNLVNISEQQNPPPATPPSWGVTGYVVAYAHNVLLENCLAQNLYGNGPNNGGLSNGFQICGCANQSPTPPNTDATSKNTTLRGCIASDIRAIDGGSVQAFVVVDSYDAPSGTIFNSNKSVVLENCISEGNYALTPTTPDIPQGNAVGFYVFESNLNPPPAPNPDQYVSGPVLFQGCKALHNVGGSRTDVPDRYSAGFYAFNALRVEFENCDAIQNVYGFLLQNCDKCAVRNCRADSNVDLFFDPGTGAGFTDLGATGTPDDPDASSSIFVNNNAYNNGAGDVHEGPDGNYNVITNLVGPVRLPLLEGSFSTADSFAPTPSFPTYFGNLHNISIIP